MARVESKTVIVTKNQRDTIPIPAGGAKSQLGSWMSESDWQRARTERFPGCMTGSRRAWAEPDRPHSSFRFVQMKQAQNAADVDEYETETKRFNDTGEGEVIHVSSPG